MDLSWLKTLAPTVATALGGPLAGIAVDVVGKALGLPDATAEKISAALTTAPMTGEQVAGLKRAEIELQAHERELGFKFAELDAADRKGARDMQVAVRSNVPALLSGAVTAGYFAILVGMMAGWLKVSDSQALLIMLGSLSTAWGMVMAFWFGSTRASEDKTALLAKAQPVK